MVNTHQHCSPKIKLVEELRYENVYFQNICHILLLHISQDINEPLDMTVTGTDP